MDCARIWRHRRTPAARTSTHANQRRHLVSPADRLAKKLICIANDLLAPTVVRSPSVPSWIEGHSQSSLPGPLADNPDGHMAAAPKRRPPEAPALRG